MRKVLIISYHFPPVNNIASRRFGGMVEYMPRFGWEPFVLTTASKGNLPVRIPEKNIIRIGENYDKGGLVSDEGYRGIPFTLKIPYFFYRKLGAEIVSIDRFIFNWGRELKTEKGMITKIKPDIIVGTSYPAVDLWMAKFFSKLTKKPWVADLEDPLSILNSSKIFFFKFIDKIIDRMLVKTASGVITLGPSFADKLNKFYNRPVGIVYNGFEEGELHESAGEKDGKLRFYYAGRFHPQRLPAIKLLINWLAQDQKYKFVLKMRSLGPREANEEIVRYAAEKNVYDKVELLPPISPEAIKKEEREANILISLNDLEKRIKNSEGQIAGKLMEYLVLRSPIISINRPDSDDGVILRSTSRGYLVSNFCELNSAIDEIMRRGFSNYYHQEKVREFSKEYQARKFCNILEDIYKNK